MQTLFLAHKNSPVRQVLLSMCLQLSSSHFSDSKCIFLPTKILSLVANHRVCKRHSKLISNFIQKHTRELKRFASLPNISALDENGLIRAKYLFRRPSLIQFIFESFLPFLADWSTVLISCGYCKKIFKAESYPHLAAEIVCPKCENFSALTPRYL